MNKKDTCYYCDQEFELDEFKDNYDGVYFLCKECYYSPEIYSLWLSNKIRWEKVDYQYED